MSTVNGKDIIEIKNQIASKFNKSDWLDFGYTLDVYDIISNHSRLLRSLDFGDDDYEGNILQVLTSIINKEANNLNLIKSYLSEKYATPEVSDFISTAHTEVPKRMITFAPQVFQVPAKSQNEKLVSVMLPFTQQKAFEAVKKACQDLSLECMKGDDIWENSTFIQDIFDLIFTSHVVVADFTGRNPNVFYEVGIAHTLGKTVIPITQSLDDIPSDLRHHRVLKYLPNEQGYEELKIELKKRLKILVPKSSDFDF